MSDIPIELRETRLEAQLTDKAEKRAHIDDVDIGEGDDDRWLKVLSTFISNNKLHLVVALPWVPDKGDADDEQEEWFLPFTVGEEDIYATRFKKSKYQPD